MSRVLVSIHHQPAFSRVCRPTPVVRFMHTSEKKLTATCVSHGTCRRLVRSCFYPRELTLEPANTIELEVGKRTTQTFFCEKTKVESVLRLSRAELRDAGIIASVQWELALTNLASRFGDDELAACKGKNALFGYGRGTMCRTLLYNASASSNLSISRSSKAYPESTEAITGSSGPNAFAVIAWARLKYDSAVEYSPLL
jgi:hypothetical protein